MKRPSLLSVCIGILFGYSALFHPSLTSYWKSGLSPFFQTWITPQTYFLITSIAAIYLLKVPLRDVSIRREGLLRQGLLGIGTGLIPIFFMLGIEALRPAAPIPCEHRWMPSELWNLFFLAPVSEELLFRGLLLSALITRFSHRTSLIVSALLFMFAHGLWAFGPLFLGLLAGWWTLRTRSIAAGITFHAVSNAYIPILCKAMPHAYAWVLKLPLLIR